MIAVMFVKKQSNSILNPGRIVNYPIKVCAETSQRLQNTIDSPALNGDKSAFDRAMSGNKDGDNTNVKETSNNSSDPDLTDKKDVVKKELNKDKLVICFGEGFDARTAFQFSPSAVRSSVASSTWDRVELSDLLMKHAQQLSIQLSDRGADGVNNILIKTGETLGNSHILLTKDSNGWHLRCSCPDRYVALWMEKVMPDLVQRFASRKLGKLVVEIENMREKEDGQ